MSSYLQSALVTLSSSRHRTPRLRNDFKPSVPVEEAMDVHRAWVSDEYWFSGSRKFGRRCTSRCDCRLIFALASAVGDDSLEGLASPAIAVGLGALAPTLGTIIPVIGARVFVVVASAAGSVVGSVAIAASFGAAGDGLSGTKMARRTGSVDEFEFKEIGENHKQGVRKLVVEFKESIYIYEAASTFAF